MEAPALPETPVLPETAVAPSPPPPPRAEGIIRFRGSETRDGHYAGTIPRGPMEIRWNVKIGCIEDWCGLGWTGQPLVAVWRKEMADLQHFLKAPPRVEVLAAGLDGKVYFVDFDTGKWSRKPLIAQHAPIKGTASLDPSGLPMIYVGQGLPGPDGFHYRGISLIDGQNLLKISTQQREWNGQRLSPFRTWGGADGNAMILPEKDLLLLGGENGLLYQVQLHSNTRLSTQAPLIAPQITATAIASGDGSHDTTAGIESSISVYNNIAYWADNIGTLIGWDLAQQKEVLRMALGDDSDSSPVILEEEGHPYLYIGSEVDKQIGERPASKKGIARLSKIDLLSQSFVWRLELPAWTFHAEDVMNDLSGGFLATISPGIGPASELLYTVTSREPGQTSGRLLAITRKAGPQGQPEIRWSVRLKGFSWSSPINDGYTVVAGDSEGYVGGYDAQTGEKLWEVFLEGAIESSPILWEDQILIGVRSIGLMKLDRVGGHAL